MSVAAAVSSAAAPLRAASTSSLRRTRLPPRVTRRLQFDERGVPRPHVKDLIVRDTHPCRLEEHYHHTLQDDVMYLTYAHEAGPRPAKRDIRLQYDPENPYTKNRRNLPVGGSQVGKQPAPVCTPQNVVKLEKIVLHIHHKDSLISRQHLLLPLMVLRALSGETERGGGHHARKGVEVVKAVKSIGGWTRRGAPVGAKVELTGPQMFEFLGTLVEFVLPRLRDFDGFVLPAGSSNMQTPAGISGVVAFGLPPAAMGFFPQLEVNVDSYPKLPGMHLTFVTNAEGQGAQNKARALLSGYQVPFVRK
jgi:large subunit ribosomal protein L5